MQDIQQLILPLAIVTAVFVLMIVFFVYLIYKYNKNLVIKNNEMFKAVIDAGEREKLELSRNLHDQVIPLIAISKLQIESFEDEEKEEIKHFKQDMISILSTSIHELRGICHNSSPLLFQELGLQKSLHNFFKQLESTGNAPKIELKYSDKIKMNYESELSVYRVLLELINNTLKYAAAKNIIIDAQLNPKNDILITYSDDGIGTETVKPGHGLLSIQSRVKILEGEVQYQSKKENGFKAQIKLPSKLLI